MRTISCVLAASLAVAASKPMSAQGLSESTFLEDALTGHPGVAAARAELAAATGDERQAGVLSNPELAWEREAPRLAARQDTWRLSWRLPFDGRKQRLAEAAAAVAAAEAMVDVTLLDVRLELREAFASWYLESEREEVLKVHLDTTQRLAEWMLARVDEGEAAGVEARRLELEVEVLSRKLAEASAEARARRAVAAVWSNLVSDDARPEQPPLVPPPASVDLSDRADLRALEHRLAQAEARERLARRVLAPPDVSVGWTELREDTQSHDGPVFGVSWSLPVLDRNQGGRRAATAEVDRSHALLEVGRRRAREHAHAALASYTTLYGAVVHDYSSVASGEVVEPVLAAFEAGEATLTDVLDALRATTDVQLARLDSLAAALAAGRELEAALGRPTLPGGSS